MRIDYAAAVLALTATVSSAHAKWDYQSFPSAFEEVTDHVIGISSQDASLVLRCRNATARWYLFEKFIPAETDARLRRGTVGGAFRVDGGPVLTAAGEYHVEENQFVLQFPADWSQVAELTTAKARVAIAVMQDDEILFETHFSADGASDAAQTLVSGCR